jgi:oligoribonuclease NrnB/cAMP/cGMP phosphodiesterase (DHH superfamily)
MDFRRGGSSGFDRCANGGSAYFKLDKKAAVEILAEVERTVSTWRVRGRELGMSAAELEQFADAFEHREREVAQSIVRKSGA